jgi:hypothetical protein
MERDGIAMVKVKLTEYNEKKGNDQGQGQWLE